MDDIDLWQLADIDIDKAALRMRASAKVEMDARILAKQFLDFEAVGFQL